MSTTLIRNLLTGRLAAWAQGQGMALGLQNAAFEPPRDAQGRIATHLMAFLLPAETQSYDYEGKHRKYHGIWQVNVVSREGVGPKAAEDLVVALDALYPVNLFLTSGAFRLQIMTPMASAAALQDGDRYTLPIRCRYEAHTI